jgi:hypothetical protein
MKKTKTPKKDSKEATPEKENKKPNGSKFGILGTDLGSKFSGGHRAWTPTKPGGRNGQGKP